MAKITADSFEASGDTKQTDSSQEWSRMLASDDESASGRNSHEMNAKGAATHRGNGVAAADAGDTDADMEPYSIKLRSEIGEARVSEGKEKPAPEHIAATHPTSYIETLIHLLKGNVGPGMFSMGDAFRNCGLVLAPILTLILGVVCVHSQHLLLSASRELKKRTGSNELPSFSETIDLAFKTGPANFVKFAKIFGILVNIFLCVTQLGFCCVYFVFISENTKQVLDYYGHVAPIQAHMAVILLPVMASCWIRNLKYLVPVSLIANVCMTLGIIGTLFIVIRDIPAEPNAALVANYSRIPLFFGSVIYSFEGIGLVLPLQAQMKKVDQFTSPMGVLNVGMAILTVLLMVVGCLGYLTYGDQVLGSLTLNLPEDEILAQCIRVVIALGVILTFAIQMYVPIIVMWPGVNNKLGPFKYPVITEIVFRSSLVLLVFALAAVIPHLGIVISLVGAISSTALALLFPAVLDIIIRWEAISQIDLVKNWAIFGLGILGFLTGTYASIDALITAISTGSD